MTRTECRLGRRGPSASGGGGIRNPSITSRTRSSLISPHVSPSAPPKSSWVNTSERAEVTMWCAHKECGESGHLISRSHDEWSLHRNALCAKLRPRGVCGLLAFSSSSVRVHPFITFKPHQHTGQEYEGWRRTALLQKRPASRTVPILRLRTHQKRLLHHSFHTQVTALVQLLSFNANVYLQWTSAEAVRKSGPVPLYDALLRGLVRNILLRLCSHSEYIISEEILANGRDAANPETRSIASRTRAS